jgi:anti-sigma B factor antagonist
VVEPGKACPAFRGAGPEKDLLDRTVIDVSYRDPTIIQERELAIRLESERDAEIVSLYGELDLASSQSLETTLLGVEESSNGNIIIDLSGLEYIDSTGLAVLLRALTRSRGSNRLTLLRGQRQVQRLFQVTGLEDQLPFLD